MKILPGKPADPEDYIVRRRAEILRAHPGFCGKELSLLDLGCGNGATMVELAKNFEHIDGLESPGFRRPVSILPAQKLMRADLEKIDSYTASLWRPVPRDRVTCFEVLEHIRRQEVVLEFIRRLIDDGGLAAISVPNKWWFFETHAKWPLNRVPFLSWMPHFIHKLYARARIYTRRKIVRMVRDAGLRIEAVHYIRAPMDRLPIRWLARILRGRKHMTRIPFLATSIMVIARKEDSDGEDETVPGKQDQV